MNEEKKEAIKPPSPDDAKIKTTEEPASYLGHHSYLGGPHLHLHFHIWKRQQDSMTSPHSGLMT